MLIYKPEKFRSLYTGELGEKLWIFLNSNENQIRFEMAAKFGRPAVEAVEDLLYINFGEQIIDLRVKQMIGHMIKQIMEFRGYRADANGILTKNKEIFKSGTRYEKDKSMLKWTENSKDIENLVQTNDVINRALEKGFILRITLSDNTIVKGVVRGQTAGNNGGDGGSYKYYGGITIADFDGKEVTIDSLDIKFVQNISTPENAKKLADKGIIKFVNPLF